MPAPENVLVIRDYDTTSITILWRKPDNPNVQQYIVSLLLLDGMNDVVNTIPLVDSVLTPVYTLINLIPGREYHISVAFAGAGITYDVLTAIQKTSKYIPYYLSL